MNHDSRPDPAQERTEWMRTTAALRRVACSLGASADEAEDIAQSTLLAALRERARGGAPGSGWLRAAARHRAIDWLRRGDRRKSPSSEEELAVRGEPKPAPPELALQFEVQRNLMAAVEALPDPYREVIFLRYFEEVSVPEIARRKDVPVPTVRTWLTRAHGRLRERLLDSEGRRSPAWIAALLEFGGGPSGATMTHVDPTADAAVTTSSSAVPFGSLSAASLLMGFKTLTAAVLALAVLGLGRNLASEQSPSEGPEPVMVGTEELEPVVTAPGMAAVDAAEARSEATTTPEADGVATAPTPVPDGRVAVRGLVFDVNGKPIAGMRVRVEPALPGFEDITTSSEGGFEGLTILEEDARSRLVPVEEGLAVIFWQGINRFTVVERKAPALLTVAPAQAILGLVLGEDGGAIMGASLQLSLPEDFPSRFSEVLAWAVFETWEVHSTVDGSFEIVGAPSLAGCSLKVTAHGYQTKVLESVPLNGQQRSSGELVITLERQDQQRIVRGVVLDPVGKPVAKARVGLGLPARVTDAAGTFEFYLDGDDGASNGPQRLLASARGWCPVQFAPDAASDGSIVWPEFVELRFQRKSLTIEGVVLDREGELRAGVSVWVDDPTVIGKTESSGVAMAENLGWAVSNLHKRYMTDDAGRFLIKDLAPRDYMVVSMDLSTLLMSQPKVIAAGESSAVLQLDPAMEIAEITGRVVDRAEVPIEGVSLEWTRFAQWVAELDGSSSRVNIVQTQPVLTGPDGKFTFKDVPLDSALKMTLTKQGYQPLDVALKDLDPSDEHLSIVLGARCEVKVFSDGSASSVRLLDATGEALKLYWSPEPGVTAQSDTVRFNGDVTLPFQVSDAAVQLEFSSGYEVVATTPIRLKPGKLNEVRQ